MSNTSVFDNRIAYRPAVVDLFRAVVEPEIKLASDEITDLQERMNQLHARIGDRKQHIAELRQAMKDVEASADLPPAALPARPPSCRTCGLIVVQRGDGRWTHKERELLDKGYLCNPKDKESPEAEPVGLNTAAMLLERIETAHDGPHGSKGMSS